MQTDCCIILTTTNEQKIAHFLAQTLIESDLAACIQIDEVISYFKWEGNVRNEPEYRLMIKGPSRNYDDIVSLIKLNHNYTLPQIVKLDINNGTQEYINWLLGAK